MLIVDTPDRLEYQFFPVNNFAYTFKIKASNDAHLALTAQPGVSFPMYEVFIGGWRNTKSVIRQNCKKPDVVEVLTPGILNGNEYRGFWIQWCNNTISVGREGEAAAFMIFHDAHMFPIQYVGICTGWGASGSWKFEGEHINQLMKKHGVSKMMLYQAHGSNPAAMALANPATTHNTFPSDTSSKILVPGSSGTVIINHVTIQNNCNLS
ncbi:C3 and PZP-like alpha-2-macroglobulin domain-containing protein 8 [Musca autumnalis]|uniref:C3 and PZP-like alpha-2-macroglobulin domain-containing protein 8 n=1 Tax=Musca autumnalis TaxID=221902 RepID=UPI003CF393EE